MKHFPMLRQLIEMIPENMIVKAMPAYGVFASLKNVSDNPPPKSSH